MNIDLDQLWARTAVLAPADRLRVAIDLLEHDRAEIAEAIAEHVVRELQLMRLLKTTATVTAMMPGAPQEEP